jgi:hypothetical protein
MAEGIDHNRLNRVIESNEPSSQPLFKNLDAGNVEELEISEIESLCIGCEEMVNYKNVYHAECWIKKYTCM